MARNYAALFHEYLDEFADLTDAEFGRLARALLVYSSTGEFPALNGNERLFKRRVIAQEDRVQESYNTVTERNRENGKLGGRPKNPEKPKKTQANPEEPTETHETPEKPTGTQKTEIEIKTEIESKIKATSPDGEAARARTRATAAAVYLDRVNTSASQMSLEQLSAYEREMGTEVCLRAMDIALDSKKATWPYIKGILSKWQSLGVKCLADIDRLDQKKTSAGSPSAAKAKAYYDPEGMNESLRKDMEWLEKFAEGKE